MINKERFLDTKIYVPNELYAEFQELIKKIFGVTNNYPWSNYYFIVKETSISDVTCETPVNIVKTQKFFYSHMDLPELHISDLRNVFKVINMKPTDFVLARDNDDEEWELAIFHHYSEEKGDQKYPYITMDSSFSQCIPYKGNEHLFMYHPNHIIKK